MIKHKLNKDIKELKTALIKEKENGLRNYFGFHNSNKSNRLLFVEDHKTCKKTTNSVQQAIRRDNGEWVCIVKKTKQIYQP